MEQSESKVMSKPNWENKTIWAKDNLEVLRGLNSESVDLIYLDPPFNSNKFYEAPIGSSAKGAKFKDVWTWNDIDTGDLEKIKRENSREWFFLQNARHAHSASMASYLLMMLPRLKEMHRILKPTGNIYLHCDPTASHYLKGLMDIIFGSTNFRNEIIWHYGKWSNAAQYFQRNHDCLLFYAMSGKSNFNHIYKQRRSEKNYHTNKVGGGIGQLLIYNEEATSQKVIDRYKKKGYRIVNVKRKGVMEHDVWTYESDKSFNFLNSQAKERCGYPTQKPLALLRRIIEASTNPGDVVLDPFCGCATTCVAAEELGREWIGIDMSAKASELVRMRVRGMDNKLHAEWDCISRDDQPQRTDAEPPPTPKRTTEIKAKLYEEQNGECVICEKHFEERNLEMDHIIPIAKGGTNCESNYQLLCGACNREKGTKTNEEAKAIRAKKTIKEMKKARLEKLDFID